MFYGSVPTQCIEQIIASFDFKSWGEVYVCCSGGFRIEQALLKRFPDLIVRSNDVSLYSCAVGRALTHDPMEIEFVDRLAFIEPLVAKDDYLGRVAAMMLSTDMARHGIGRQTRYKTQIFNHMVATFPEQLVKMRAKVATMVERTPITSYFAGDWRDHMETAIEAGAGIAAFPPFFKGDYEKMFAFVHQNTKWPEPSYRLYDPHELGSLVRRMEASGVRYCVLSDQVFTEPAPVMSYVQGRKVPHYGYGTPARASVRHITRKSEPFAYKAVDFTKLTAKTEVRVMPCTANQANFLEDVYLAKSIVHTSGMANYLIYLDDMLVGAIIYSLSTRQSAFGRDSIYLLSDVTTSREGKLSKFVAKTALSARFLDELSIRFMTRLNKVITTARSKHPVSMKYRDIYKLHNRHEPPEPGGEYVINYLGDRTGETPQQIYDWWWKKYGKKSVGEALLRSAEGRPEILGAA